MEKINLNHVGIEILQLTKLKLSLCIGCRNSHIDECLHLQEHTFDGWTTTNKNRELNKLN